MSTASQTVPAPSQSDTLEVSDLLRLLEQKDHLIAQHEQAIIDREQAIVDREHIIEDHKHIIEEQQKLLKLMEEKLRLARQKRFGASSEKLPFQGDFFDEAELEIALDSMLKPLIELIRAHQVSGDYLQADETRIQVLKENGKVATSDKWMWVVRGGPPG